MYEKKIAIYLVVFVSCYLWLLEKGSAIKQTLYSGEIRIAVDESLKPIMEEELQVYHAVTPEATIVPVYCSEVEAINLFLKDSVRLVIANRRLTDQEISSFHTRKFFPESIRFAIGGIALITNRHNPDSLISKLQFRDILAGKIVNWSDLYPSSDLGRIQVVLTIRIQALYAMLSILFARDRPWQLH